MICQPRLLSLPQALRAVNLLILTALLSGCYTPKGPVPQPAHPSVVRDYTPEQVRERVVRVRGQIHRPISVAADMPRACQNLSFNHFGPRTAVPLQPAEADAVILLMPGMLSGANALSHIAEELVYHAALAQRHLQVVTVERRNQCLNDLTGFNAAEAAGDVQLAVDYYYHGANLAGREFAGFYQSRDLPFLAEFGLARAVEDFHAIAQHLLPDSSARREKLFIGGHSLGGNITSAYMGWDFDGDRDTQEDAGYRNAAGFIRLDIGITPLLPEQDRFLAYGAGQVQADATDEANQAYRKDVQRLQSGSTSRVVRMPGVDAESLSLLELVAMQAHWHPDEESRLVHEIPMGATPKTLLRLIHSESLGRFLTNKPSFFDFRYTHEAMLGLILDNDFMPISILQTGLGFLGGGAMNEKRFPNSPIIADAASLVDDFLAAMITSNTQFIARDAGPSLAQLGEGPLYHWVSFDQVGRAVDPVFSSSDGSVEFTHIGREVSDIQTVARIIYEGELSFTEWYMPARLSLDLSMLVQGRLVEGLPFYHAEARRSVPLLEIVASESFVDTSIVPLGRLEIAEGYSHVDIITAANDRSEHQQNRVIQPILTFIDEVQSSNLD